MRRNINRSGVLRKQKNDRYSTRDWVDRLVDIPVFVIGNGPSLNDLDLTLINDYFTIGINRSFLAITSTILLWQDISFWNTEYHRIHNLPSIKVCRDIADPRRIYYNFHLRSGPYQFGETSHIISGAGSSGPMAVIFAHSLGCRRIVLLGFDCKVAKNGDSDFYGKNKFHNYLTFPACIKGLEFLKQQTSVEIISCSDNDYFERISLEKAIEMIDPKCEYRLGNQVYSKMILRN